MVGNGVLCFSHFQKAMQKGIKQGKDAVYQFLYVLQSRKSSEAGPMPSFACPSPHYALRTRVIPAGCPVSCFALPQGQAKVIQCCASPTGTPPGQQKCLEDVTMQIITFQRMQIPFLFASKHIRCQLHT